MSKNEVKEILEREYQRGLEDGIAIMKQKILSAYKNDTPINIEGRAFFIKSDIQYLRYIFDCLEHEVL